MRRPATVSDKVAQGMAAAIEVGECLEWQGPFSCGGRTPVAKAKTLEKKRTDNFAVPRELWAAAYGPIPAGMLVFRTCCNNRCVLLDHLSIGTRKDWAKARKKMGATKHSPVAKPHLTLAARRRADVVNTMEKARQVRSLAAARIKTDEITRLTGVSPAMVAEIRQNSAWREFGGNPWQGLGA